jgi:hypothetical protein
MTAACSQCGRDNPVGAVSCAGCGVVLAQLFDLAMIQPPLVYLPLLIATIQRLTGVPFADARRAVAGEAPIARGLPPLEALRIAKELVAAGGTVTITPSPVN